MLSGTFNWTTGAATCQDCPAGYLCGVRTSDYSSRPCPIGNYCPAKLDSGAPVPCPAGTFNPFQRLQQNRQCQPCLPGEVCSFKGISKPSSPCPAGSYCNGEGEQNGQGGSLIMQCKAGSYCPEGVPLPITCPPGKVAVTFCPLVELSGAAYPNSAEE